MGDLKTLIPFVAAIALVIGWWLGNKSSWQKFESSWFKSLTRFATKQDLKEMEQRLTDAIAKRADITPAIETAALKVQSALDKLDASIPDRK